MRTMVMSQAKNNDALSWYIDMEGIYTSLLSNEKQKILEEVKKYMMGKICLKDLH